MPLSLPYYIEITKKSKQYIAKYLRENPYSKVFILLDENSKKYCFPILENTIENAIEIEIESGEENKTLETCSFIWQALTEANADRNALLVNLGGGVIGDMGGFCASTYKRGIDFINIPTTLLSQVDASIGGKLGVDFNGYKNHIGLFNLPKKVIIDPIFLQTLAPNQIRSGFAEMLKHGFIKDRNHLNELTKIDTENCNWLPYIEKSIKVKNEIVESDPYEKNKRKFLNFGHTIGHAVESYFINNNLLILHGEAVALGIITEAYLSSKHLNMESYEQKKVIEVIDSFFDRVKIPKNGVNEILKNLDQDKKNTNSVIQSVLLTKIGQAKHSIEISKEDVLEALNFYGFK